MTIKKTTSTSSNRMKALMRHNDGRSQEELSIMLLRIVMKLLQVKNMKRTTLRAKMIIQDCAERKNRNESGYKNLTPIMTRRIQALVGDKFWDEAIRYLTCFFVQQKTRRQTERLAATPAPRSE